MMIEIADSGPTGSQASLTDASAVVIEDGEVVRAGLVQTLRRLGCTVVAEGAAGDDMFGAMMRFAPDLAIIGTHTERRPSELVRLLKSVAFHVKTVHLAAQADREEFVELLKAGTEAVIPLSIRPDELARALRRVLAGERVYEGVTLAAVRTSLEASPDPKLALSPRERQVLAHLATRASVAVIASELYISVATVKTHSARIYEKLDADSRYEAVERAVALGILT
jgi:two-component system invasion response regulator UvrY